MKEIIISLAWFFSILNNIESPEGMPVPYPAEHIGPYQISYEYWLDSGMPGKWENCLDESYSEEVMVRYWERYVPQALEDRDYQTLARVHYGGPFGYKKESTKFYWDLVVGELNKERRCYAYCTGY